MAQTYYIVTTKGTETFSEEFLKEELDVDINDSEQRDIMQMTGAENTWRMNLTESQAQRIRELPFVGTKGVMRDLDAAGFGNTFPYDTTHFRWSEDNWGPLWVPAKGSRLTLTKENISLYRRIISVYEGNDLKEVDGKFLINGKETTDYTFQMDYHWLMGDNRHNSQDSRFWGFVPEDHIVGKASLIWFSWQNGPRWKRLFNLIK
jgi:signal peptidase I